MPEFTLIQQICIWALPVLLAITFHELAHGYVAYRCGDNTAKMFGRLTLNPIKHIDPIGTVLLPLYNWCDNKLQFRNWLRKTGSG